MTTDIDNTQCDGILVLGIARSGTSLTSSLVQKWAQYKGDPGKRKIVDPTNPNGYFESGGVQSVLVDAVSHVIQSTGVSSWSPSFNENLQALVTNNTRFVSALDTEFKRIRDIGSPWCSKAPVLSVTVALWEHMIEEPVLIVPVRNPYDTARSLLKLEGKKVSRGGIVLNLLAWQHYLVRVLKDTAKFKHRYFICYEDIIQHPEAEITKLADFLSTQFPHNGNQKKLVKDMLAMVEPRLHRNKASVGFDQRDEPTCTQKQLYKLLMELAKDNLVENPLDVDKYQLTEQEIDTLDENNSHILSNLRKRPLSEEVGAIVKYYIGKLKSR